MSARPLSFSVVVVSNGRSVWLSRCLTALKQLDYPAFEIVVVADGEALQALSSHPVLAFCRTVVFDAANISHARNLGIAEAAGEVVVFIDDDSVPEPEWLTFHAEALEKTGAAASVGFVRGRNGISFQSRAASVDAEAETHSEPTPSAPVVLHLRKGRATKLVGTNAAVRRSVLMSLGGFDTAFRFFLDDADLSLRLAKAGHAIAVAPLAEVHHAFAASVRRTALRCPTSLYEIGRSSAVFLRRHRGIDAEELKDRIDKRERRRLLQNMVRGTCEPRDVGRLLADLDSGWEDGLRADLPRIEIEPTRKDFRSIPPFAPGHCVLSGRFFQRPRLKAQAATLATQGQRVSVFSFSLTLIRHHLMFTRDGYWLQTGGQFGRSTRDSRRVEWYRFAERVNKERARIEKQRGIADIKENGGG